MKAAISVDQRVSSAERASAPERASGQVWLGFLENPIRMLM